MRFNKSSHQSDRAAGADECADQVHDALPAAELEELAEQLRSDALHLADRYPANSLLKPRGASAGLSRSASICPDNTAGQKASSGTLASEQEPFPQTAAHRQLVLTRRRLRTRINVPFGAAAAVLLVACFWSAWSLTGWHKREADLDDVAAAATEAVRFGNAGHLVQPTIDAGPAPLVMPTMSFRDLTAAEQEALMDLLDDDQYAARLSI